MSSLSAQLATIASVDAGKLAGTQRPASFIYTSRHSASVSLVTLHSLAANAWDQLATLDPFFATYQAAILGQEAKETERTSLTKEENLKLDKVLDKVLRGLGKWMLLKPAGVVLEWLIRRFRINEFNIPALVSLFLPYHTTPFFPSALALIAPTALGPSSPFSSFLPARSSLAPLPLPALVALLPPFSSVASANDLLKLIIEIPLSYLPSQMPHRALTGFWLQLFTAYLDRAGSEGLDQGQQGLVLSTIIAVIQQAKGADDILVASFILLTQFGKYYPFTTEELKVVMKVVVGHRNKHVGVLGEEEGDDVAEVDKERAWLTTLVLLPSLAEEDMQVKEGKKFLGGSGWKALMNVDNLDTILVDLSENYEAVRFLTPFLATLALEAITSVDALDLLLSLAQSLPIAHLSPLLLSTFNASLSTSPATSLLLPVLSLLSQRHPALYATVSASLVPSDDLSHLLRQVLGGHLTEVGVDVLQTESPELVTRIAALHALIAPSSAGLRTQEGNADFVQHTLLARLAEGEIDLYNVLFSNEGLAVIHEVLAEDKILATLRVVLGRSTITKGSRRAVLVYLAGSFVAKYPATKDELVRAVVWSTILRSKDVEIVLGSLGKEGWLAGVVQGSNEVVVGRIAANIAKLNASEQEEAISFLLKNGSVLDSLVLAAIVPLIKDGARVELVGRILSAIKVERGLDALVSTASGTKVDSIWTTVEESKDGYPDVVRGYTVESAIAGLARLESSEWTWLASGTSVQLAYTVYQLGHTGTTPRAKALGSKILNSLFTTLVTSSALAFFASIFTSTSMATELKVIALQDTATFLTVLATVEGGVDCQLLVPAVLVALGQGEKKIRVQAMETIKVLKETMKADSVNVYGRDCFYGAATSQLVQYLDTADTLAYLDRVLSSRTEIIMDPSHLSTLHALLLDPSTPDAELKKKKKKATLKFKTFTFLLSHAAAWVSVEARTTILKALEDITESAKTTLLVPLLREAITADVSVALFASVDVEVTRSYCRLLLQPYGATTRKWLELEENNALATFLDVLEVEDVIGAGAMLRQGALTIVGATLFNLVKGESKIDLLRRLARLAAVSDARLSGDVLAALRACKVDGETVTAFLSEIRLSLASPVSKGAKRGRTSIGNVTSRAERLPELVVLLESVDFSPVAASHTLILVLFDLLSTLIEISTAAQTDIQYVGQLLLSTLSKVVENVGPASGVTSDSIRMSPVLDFMRSSVNPQTSHQALLLLAQLGPLVPDQLVHNVMPIFTFMGANVLQRDDAYSLRVVERTLESIVPALVKAIKTSSGNRDALVSDLKELLRIFTDAAAHVPRHRRIKLFVRFVETLGPREFLSAVSLLLLDKTIKATDSNSLPLAVFEHFPVDMQLSALKQIIEELPKLIQRGTGAAAEPFLDLSAESSDRVTAAAKEQITNVAGFLALALEAKQLGGKIDAARASNIGNVDLTLSELVRGLLEISSVPLSANYTASDKADLEVLTGYSLQASVRLMSTQAFSEAVLWLLDINDSAIEASALGLLRSRLPTIKSARRGDISPAVVNVIDRVRASLADVAADKEDALETLEVIATSVYTEEDSALAKAVPDLMAVASAASVPKSTRVLAMGIIKKLSYRLGPRLIPLASKLTPFAVDILRQEAQLVPLSSITSHIVISAFEILQGLFTSIPTFIGGQLDKVFDAALSIDILSLTEDKDSGPAKARAHLLSTAAKKIPAKTLYPAVIRLYASLDGVSKEPILGLLDLLNRSLRQGTTADVAENFRPIFKLFLTIFDLRREHASSLSNDDINQIEENGLGAFTQFILKLNEQTFRPLFLRTYDWAVIDLADSKDAEKGLVARKTVLYKLVDRLLSQLKAIVVPYFSFMLDQTIELLGSFSRRELADSALFTSILDALTKSIDYDESGFWTPVRLRKLSAPIASQLSSSFSATLLHKHLHPLLASYSRALLPHELLLKSFNTSILMLTRDDDLSIKRGSLEALEQLWDSLGDGMLLFVPETTPFLAETMEETEEGVAMVTQRLIKRIEEHLGETLDSYLEN